MGLSLRENIEFYGFSVNSFADHIGMPQSSLHRIVSDEAPFENVSVGTGVRIAQGLGMSVEQLYYGDDMRDRQKRELSEIFDGIDPAGRSALLACARGIWDAYPASIIPTVDSPGLD